MNIFKIFNRGPGVATASPGGHQITKLGGTQLPAATAETMPGGITVERRAGNPNAKTPAPDLPKPQPRVKLAAINETMFIPPPVIAALAKEAGDDLLSKAAREEFKKAQAKWDELDAFQNRHTYRLATEEFFSRKKRLTERLQAGETINDAPEVSCEELQADYLVKQKAAYQRSKVVLSELLPRRLEIAEILGRTALKCAKRIEADEKALAEKWGCEYQECALVRVLKFAADHPHEMVNLSAIHPPKMILKSLGITI